MCCAAKQIAEEALKEGELDLVAVYLAGIVQGGNAPAAANSLCRLSGAQVSQACIPTLTYAPIYKAAVSACRCMRAQHRMRKRHGIWKGPPHGMMVAEMWRTTQDEWSALRAMHKPAAQVLRSLVELSRPPTAARIVAALATQGRVGFVRAGARSRCS